MKTFLKTVFLMAIILLPCRLSAYWDFEYQNLYFKITDADSMTVEVVKPQFREGTVTIPSTAKFNGQVYKVTRIGVRAFADCEDLSIVIISDGVKIIDHSAFRNCKKLSSVKVPESVTEIHHDAFMDCESLKSFTIGANVTLLGAQVFKNCLALDKVTIECNIERYKPSVFGNCKNLSLIIMRTMNPPNISCNVFEGVDKSVDIFVPKKSLARYKKDIYWNKFPNIMAVK